MKRHVTFIGERFWITQLADGLNERYPEAVDCAILPFDDVVKGPLHSLLPRLLTGTVVRYGFPPRAALPPFEPAEGVELPSGSAKVRSRYSTWSDRTLHPLRALVRLDPATRRFWIIDRVLRLASRTWLRRSYFYFWIGTDVLQFLDGFGGGLTAGPRADVLRARNLAIAPHLSDELRGAEVNAWTVQFPWKTPTVPSPLPGLPQEFVALSYLPSSRFEFYGGHTVMEAARRMPHVRFRLVSREDTAVESELANVERLGAVNDLSRLYSECSVVLRMTEHDGSSMTVAEAHLFGRWVIHSYPMPHCIYVRYGDTDSLVRAIEDLHRQHAAGDLEPDYGAAEWAAHEFDEDTRFAALYALLSDRSRQGGSSS